MRSEDITGKKREPKKSVCLDLKPGPRPGKRLPEEQSHSFQQQNRFLMNCSCYKEDSHSHNGPCSLALFKRREPIAPIRQLSPIHFGPPSPLRIKKEGKNISIIRPLTFGRIIRLHHRRWNMEIY
ncbi:hypothetical protein NPIL_257091 [Nephila pilipes]|uniref:Uncharacterized protein n=1 Tax=Nephila pilipes TaxID=299642 RepID=A0A8X6NGT7_NEPPI|nr:hypothetical protein NPIL_257091 [Nephila pilipes]